MLLVVVAFVGYGCSSSQSPEAAGVKAAFGYGCMGVVDSPIVFVNKSTGAEGYQWDLGDGRISTEAEPTVTFDATGTYRVRLRSQASDGSVDSAVRMVRIYPPIGASHALHFTEQLRDSGLLAWIGNVTSILGYFGTTETQCKLVSALLRSDCCSQTFGCNIVPSDGEVQLLLEDFGKLETSFRYAPLGFDQLRAEIWQDRPVYARFENSVYRYDLVVIGYDANEILNVFDAAKGSYSISYKDFLQHSVPGQPGAYRWMRTIDCIRKVVP
jgi:hypothetical protein